MNRIPSAVALSGVMFAALACSSSPKPLYRADDQSSLRDGFIRIETNWGDETRLDVREIVAKDGRVRAVFDGRLGPGLPWRRKEGEVLSESWESLWRRLGPVAPWASSDLTVEPDEPRSGPYHLVTLQIGDRVRRFSVQTTGGIFAIATRSATERFEYLNALTEFVSIHASDVVREGPPPDAGAASAPTAPETP